MNCQDSINFSFLDQAIILNFSSYVNIEKENETVKNRLVKNIVPKLAKISSESKRLSIVVVMFPDIISCSRLMDYSTVSGINAYMVNGTGRRSVKNKVSGL